MTSTIAKELRELVDLHPHAYDVVNRAADTLEYLMGNQPVQEPKKKDMEWMLTNAFYRMYNHGKNDNPVSAQCEVQALGMYLRGNDMPAWKTSVVNKPVQPVSLPKVKPWYKESMYEQPVQLTGLPKMANGCCHKTVVTRCKDCSFNKEVVDKK